MWHASGGGEMLLGNFKGRGNLDDIVVDLIFHKKYGLRKERARHSVALSRLRVGSRLGILGTQ
jgi:hypothetical protein